eukprot:757262-Hanusia_phi.AAC.1
MRRTHKYRNNYTGGWGSDISTEQEGWEEEKRQEEERRGEEEVSSEDYTRAAALYASFPSDRRRLHQGFAALCQR